MNKAGAQREKKAGNGKEMMREVAQAKQGPWLNWESVEKKKLSWRDLWNMEESRIRLSIGTTTMCYQPLRT